MSEAGEQRSFAREALERGDYDAASTAAVASVESVGDGESHEVLGGLFVLDDRFADAQRHWEAAFRLYRDVADHRSAARIAIYLASLNANFFDHPAAGRGWTERARGLIDRVGPCVERGYLELAFMACDRPDVDDLLESTERALAIALEFGDSDLEVQAMADSGLALVSQGRVSEGFARLDAALAAISAGEVGPAVAGMCFCSMLSACDRAGDVRRAEEWTRHHRGRPRAASATGRACCTRIAASPTGRCSAPPGAGREAEALMLEALGPADAAELRLTGR